MRAGRWRGVFNSPASVRALAVGWLINARVVDQHVRHAELGQAPLTHRPELSEVADVGPVKPQAVLAELLLESG